MKYLSVCSGIEAATQAWHPLGWEPVGFSEIEPFPAAVLKHHYPQTTNHGDMTKHEQWNIPSGSVDLLVGGTPCQSFSVAGLRKGLHDPRGGLMLTFLEIAQRMRPRWIVWENVPGVLSSNGGRDFGSFLGALGELGYGWAYRVLDAQWFGVAQRRRRVFVVGCLGDGNAAAKVLFERESVRRDSPPSREKRQGVAGDAQEGAGGKWPASIASTLNAAFGSKQGLEDKHAVLFQKSELRLTDKITLKDVCPTLKAGTKAGDSEPLALLYENHPNDSRVTGPHKVAPSCVSRFGTVGGNVPLVQERLLGQVDWRTANADGGNVSQTLKTDLAHQSGPCLAVDVYNQAIDGDVAATLTKAVGGTNTSGAKVMAFQQNASGEVRDSGVAYSLNTNSNASGRNTGMVQAAMAVRRLSPRECERLQGFPDDYTMIPWRGKPADQCPDGPRYKALGNSMAVPCMRWIGERIANFVAQTTKGESK